MFLDTTFCIDLMREQAKGKDGPATAKLEKLLDQSLRIPLFVLCELHAGALMSSRPQQELRKVELFSDLVDIVSPNASFAIAYGEAEAFLRKKGMPISTMDLLIGVTAKMHGEPLLTHNPSPFKKIPGLVVETY